MIFFEKKIKRKFGSLGERIDLFRLSWPPSTYALVSTRSSRPLALARLAKSSVCLPNFNFFLKEKKKPQSKNSNSCRTRTNGTEGGPQVCQSQAHFLHGLHGLKNEAGNPVPQMSAPSPHY